jgi:hypothetical protein
VGLCAFDDSLNYCLVGRGAKRNSFTISSSAAFSCRGLPSSTARTYQPAPGTKPASLILAIFLTTPMPPSGRDGSIQGRNYSSYFWFAGGDSFVRTRTSRRCSAILSGPSAGQRHNIASIRWPLGFPLAGELLCRPCFLRIPRSATILRCAIRPF